MSPEILAFIADEKAWNIRFSDKRDIILRMAIEALQEDERGETVPLDDLLGPAPD